VSFIGGADGTDGTALAVYAYTIFKSGTARLSFAVSFWGYKSSVSTL